MRPARRGYPRPQLCREGWVSLDGTWEFALDHDVRWQAPAAVAWDAAIEVPYAPETPASGIAHERFIRACWYRRSLDVAAPADRERLVLHFGAVDYEATVWIDDRCVGRHEGGYTPFAIDVTDALRAGGRHVLTVRAEDDPQDMAKPRGKQDWLLQPHSIWYPRTTGIWQSVWLERVPDPSIASLAWTPNLERWELGLEACVAGRLDEPLRLRVRLAVGALALADDTYTVLGHDVVRRIALSDPGIDDYRNELLWSPNSPTLIDARLELLRPDATVVDAVTSYTALRSATTQGDRFVLNGRPLPLRLVLDQGYWPESGLTAPSDAALRRDVELVKAMGFNGARKHQKLEDPRWLYWCDRLGLLVWEEMPSAYRFTKRATERLTREWMSAVQRDYSHPSIVAWVPFNESWGVPNLPDVPAERHFVQALYHLTRTLDPTRPVVGNDGWESVATDIVGIHDYHEDPRVLAARYRADEELPRLFRRERPGGRVLTLGEHGGQPIVLSEFGGISLSAEEGTWGYARVPTSDALAARYEKLLKVVRGLPLLTGFCYTQLTDTYQEANGLLYADRSPKFPLERIASATRGSEGEREQQVEQEWRARMQRLHGGQVE